MVFIKKYISFLVITSLFIHADQKQEISKNALPIPLCRLDQLLSAGTILTCSAEYIEQPYSLSKQERLLGLLICLMPSMIGPFFCLINNSSYKEKIMNISNKKLFYISYTTTYIFALLFGFSYAAELKAKLFYRSSSKKERLLSLIQCYFLARNVWPLFMYAKDKVMTNKDALHAIQIQS